MIALPKLGWAQATVHFLDSHVADLQRDFAPQGSDVWQCVFELERGQESVPCPFLGLASIRLAGWVSSSAISKLLSLRPAHIVLEGKAVWVAVP